MLHTSHKGTKGKYCDTNMDASTQKHQEAGSKKQQAYHTEHLVHGHNKKQYSKQHSQASLTCLPDMLSVSSGRSKLLILRPGAEKASRSWLLLAAAHHITASWPSCSS